MKKSLAFLLSCLLLTLASPPAQAESKAPPPKTAQPTSKERPINLSLVTPIQIFNARDSIAGFRLNFLYGRNHNMTGFDLGLVNHSTGSVKGVQWGLVGITEGDFVGWAGNGVNIVYGAMKGLQSGIVNYAGKMKGLQLGFVNYAKRMDKGLQIGLVNIIRENGWLPFMIIVNGRF